MIRTSFAIAFAVAFSTTAFAAPMAHARLKSRLHVKPFTAAEKLIFERASVFTGVGGDGGGGSGGGSSN